MNLILPAQTDPVDIFRVLMNLIQRDVFIVLSLFYKLFSTSLIKLYCAECLSVCMITFHTRNAVL